ncbi:Clr5 domain-containing protein [Phyllosticta paracitricarpa]|uniref:Clr5 domain-containing protein n=1 Tax=Phyllosticta paracitricarpa TaxID=2016321 RepID=A0ABR1MYJ7_9PEZI
MAPTWESLKEAIRELYLVQNASKEYVMSEMRRLHNFTATEAQYERQLKRWKFRKNLTTRDHITLNGEPVSSKKLKKKASTSGYQTTWDKLQASLQVCDHRSPTPEGIVVCTPPAGPADEPHQIEVFGLSPSHAPRSPSLPVARSIATLWESSTNSTHPGEGRIYPNALQVALVKALMTQKLPDTKSNHLLAKQWVNLCGRKGLPMNISMALKSNSNIHMLQLPQKLPIMPQMEALAGAVAQETLLLNELKLLTNLIMQSGSGIAKIRAAQDLNSETTTFSNLPIEFSIGSRSMGENMGMAK